MARYIDADILYDKLDKMQAKRKECTVDYLEVFELVEKIPTAEIVEVKHAHWLDDIQKVTTVAGVEFNGFVGYRCSLCGRREPSKEPYCNCGAKMRGEPNVKID